MSMGACVSWSLVSCGPTTTEEEESFVNIEQAPMRYLALSPEMQITGMNSAAVCNVVCSLRSTERWTSLLHPSISHALLDSLLCRQLLKWLPPQATTQLVACKTVS